MYIIGLDAGTTTISGVLIDTDRMEMVTSKTIPNQGLIYGEQDWENIQNPEIIYTQCKELLDYFSGMCPKVSGIGITGQMHGILYIDSDGHAVSNLFTWQDGRGDLEYKDGITYCDHLNSISEYPVATGYGLTTHFYNFVNQLVPQKAVSFCTIADYLAIRLSHQKSPIIHQSNAASFGFYDPVSGVFDLDKVQLAGIPEEILPKTSQKEMIIGYTAESIPVCIAVGDNQASFIGSVNSQSNILINIGTSSQLSFFTNEILPGRLENRPFVEGGNLLVGSGLCGGSAYQLIGKFFSDTLNAFGFESSVDKYAIMEKIAREAYEQEEKLIVDARFRGTRTNPNLRGSIRNIGVSNLSPGNLVAGVLSGICAEMKAFYDEIPDDFKQSEVLIGSGNAIRKNSLLRRILMDTFEKELLVPRYEEEASLGAALLAASLVQEGKNLSYFKKIIQY